MVPILASFALKFASCLAPGFTGTVEEIAARLVTLLLLQMSKALSLIQIFVWSLLNGTSLMKTSHGLENLSGDVNATLSVRIKPREKEQLLKLD